MNDTLLVLTNVPDDAAATAIAQALIGARLAACVNILAPCTSMYRWDGAIERAAEIPLLIKTTTARYAELEAQIRAIHPYTVPEIIAMPIVAGSSDYLAWVAGETARPTQA